MAFEHVFWGYKQVPNGVLVGSLQGYDDKWKLNEGIDLAEEFPADAYFEMLEDFPDNTLPTDLARNRDELIVVSERLKHFVTEHSGTGLQFLPVAIRDHKGKPLPSAYYIVNPQPALPCFDLKKSKPTYSELYEERIVQMESFEPDPKVCKSLPDVIRPKGIWHLMISKSLAKALDGAGMTGSGTVDPAKLAGDEIPDSLRGLTRKK